MGRGAVWRGSGLPCGQRAAEAAAAPTQQGRPAGRPQVIAYSVVSAGLLHQAEAHLAVGCGRVHLLQRLPGPEGPQQVLVHRLVGGDQVRVVSVNY